MTYPLADKKAEDALELLNKGRVDKELNRETVCTLNLSRGREEKGNKGSDGLNRDECQIDLERKMKNQVSVKSSCTLRRATGKGREGKACNPQPTLGLTLPRLLLLALMPRLSSQRGAKGRKREVS